MIFCKNNIKGGILYYLRTVGRDQEPRLTNTNFPNILENDNRKLNGIFHRIY